jgi:hypothetical protein
VTSPAANRPLPPGLHDLLKRNYKRLRHEEPGIGASLAAGVASASMGQVRTLTWRRGPAAEQLRDAPACAPACAPLRSTQGCAPNKARARPRRSADPQS